MTATQAGAALAGASTLDQHRVTNDIASVDRPELTLEPEA